MVLNTETDLMSTLNCDDFTNAFAEEKVEEKVFKYFVNNLIVIIIIKYNLLFIKNVFFYIYKKLK